MIVLVSCKRQEAPPKQPPPVVEVMRPITRDVPIYGEWVATLDGSVNAQIQPRVDGYVISQNVRDGSYVRKGEVLFEIDPRPLRAALEQARGQLGESIANEARTARDVERDRPLAEARAIPKSQLETDIELHRSAVAAVQAARANVRQAELNLGFTKVRSLIDGIVGVAQIQIGNLVSPTSVLTTVSQIEPIRAWFAISEQEYLDPSNRLHDAVLASAADRRAPLQFELTLATGSKYSHTGRFLFANRQVDSLMGTMRVAAAFPNPQRVLRPGQFGRVRAAIRVERNAVLVPQRAVSELQGTYQLMVLKSDSTVAVQPVEVGPRVDSLWLIQRGLRADQLVIVEGAQKARPGIKVTARPYQPTAQKAPSDSQSGVPLPAPGKQQPPRKAY